MPVPAATTQSPQSTRRPWSFTSIALACIIAATVANLGLYAIGRATDATLRIDPGAGAPNHLIIPIDVAWKTVVPLALAALVLALIARRSRRWTTALIVVGVVGVLATIPFVFTGAHDATTGLLLAGMHTIGALAYLLIGVRARANATL